MRDALQLRRYASPISIPGPLLHIAQDRSPPNRQSFSSRFMSRDITTPTGNPAFDHPITRPTPSIDSWPAAWCCSQRGTRNNKSLDGGERRSRSRDARAEPEAEQRQQELGWSVERGGCLLESDNSTPHQCSLRSPDACLLHTKMKVPFSGEF